VDPAGTVVANAPVEVRNVNTGALFQGGTSATGNYVISVPVGNYELTVSVTGFKRYVRQNVEVPVATAVRLDVSLEVGSNTETITVTDAAPLLKTETGEISYSVKTERANQLPVLALNGANIRNPLQVVTLLPGAQFANDTIFRINGMPANTQAIRIEGQDATNGIWKQQTQIAQSGVDAIEEVAIQTSNFAAEFGQAGGRYVNMTMKSGTNQFHGSAYTYFVNEFLHAGTPYTDAGITNSLKTGQHIRNKQRRIDYGFTFGGPVLLPKLYHRVARVLRGSVPKHHGYRLRHARRQLNRVRGWRRLSSHPLGSKTDGQCKHHLGEEQPHLQARRRDDAGRLPVS
jgi:hypothetical protein